MVRGTDKGKRVVAALSNLEAERGLADGVREHIWIQALRDSVAQTKAHQPRGRKEDAREGGIGGIEFRETGVAVTR